MIEPETHHRLATFFSNLDAHSGDASLTHRMHPYPAKFIPPIARELIGSLSGQGETVLDPMCGSGTTAVEAIAQGRFAIASDINPVSLLITRAKTTPLSEADEELLDEMAWKFANFAPSGKASAPHFMNIDHWFEPGVIRALSEIKQRIDELPPGAVQDLCATAFSAIIVPVSNQEGETSWRRKNKGVTEQGVYTRFAHKLSSVTAQAYELTRANPLTATVLASDARNLQLANESVDLIVTSPPYANSHDYYLYNKLRLFWLGFDVKPVQEAEFGSRNKHSDKRAPFQDYLAAMQGVLGEARRVLRQDGRAAIVVGDSVIRGEFFSMSEHLAPLGEHVGLELVDQHRYHQQRYTRAFGRKFGTSQPKDTHIFIYEKS